MPEYSRSIDDLARYCRMLLNEGELDGTRVLNSDTVRLMTSVQSPDAVEGTAGPGLGYRFGLQPPAREALSNRFVRTHRLHRHEFVDRSVLTNVLDFLE